MRARVRTHLAALHLFLSSAFALAHFFASFFLSLIFFHVLSPSCFSLNFLLNTLGAQFLARKTCLKRGTFLNESDTRYSSRRVGYERNLNHDPRSRRTPEPVVEGYFARDTCFIRRLYTRHAFFPLSLRQAERFDISCKCISTLSSFSLEISFRDGSAWQ